jgi:YesN/AraC family two-component response regulator
MKQVLFVDDEQNVLDGLKRMLYQMRHEWRMAFVRSGHEALELLSQSEYDVLVTDLRMPVMSGMELLAKVASLHPQVVRVVLSGTADQETALRSATLAHQYLVRVAVPAMVSTDPNPILFISSLKSCAPSRKYCSIRV